MKSFTILLSLLLGANALPLGNGTANGTSSSIGDMAKAVGSKVETTLLQIVTGEEMDGLRANVTATAEEAVGDFMGTETAAKIKAALPSQVKEILGAFAGTDDEKEEEKEGSE